MTFVGYSLSFQQSLLLAVKITAVYAGGVFAAGLVVAGGALLAGTLPFRKPNNTV